MASKLKGNLSHEAQRAALSSAGWRVLAVGTTSPLTAAEDDYTVLNPQTRRVVISHMGAALGDIRFAILGTAITTSFILQNDVYTVVDARQDDVLSFFNNNASTLQVSVMELD